MRRLAWLPLLFALGCASMEPPPVAPAGPQAPGAAPATPAQPAAPPANPKPQSNVNLQGFPLEYRQGYADGCTSAKGTEQKDAARYKSDGQYRTGWQDGNALCRKR